MSNGSNLYTPPIGLQWYSVIVVAATFFLVIAGGMVTSTGSGLAVPDWPLSFGKWMPPMEGGVFYEHGHRMVAATVGCLTVIMALWTSLSHAPATFQRLAWTGVGLVIVQGLFGGLTVLLKLPVWTSAIHACLGQSFFALTVCVAAWMHPPPRLAEVPSKVERLAWMTAGFVFLQLVLGAVYRHSGTLLHAHMAGAVLVVVHVILLWTRLKHSAAGPLVKGLFGLVWIQVVLGLIAWQRPYVGLTTAHVAAGALLLAGSTLVAVQLHRSRPARCL